MDRNADTKTNEALELTLTLPSGKTCRAKVYPANSGLELIDVLMDKGLLRPGEYEFVSAWGTRMDAGELLGGLFAPGAPQASARLEQMDDDTDGFRPIQVLYGCPTAVTEQAVRLAHCTVTRTEL